MESGVVPGLLLPCFDFEAPATVAQAAALLAGAGEDARLLAGGTDLLVKMKRRVLQPRLLVSLQRIDGLDGLAFDTSGGLRVGAMTSMTMLAEEPRLAECWAALAEAAGSVGGPLIRNRATVGGNIINARPCADTVPALVALGATLRLERLGASRTEEIDGFVTAPGETRREPGEILTAIHLPPAEPDSGSAYVKITRRAAMEVTIVGCAAAVALDGGGRIVRRARLVFTSVAPTPLRVREAEQILEGRVPEEEALREAAAAARRAARPIDDCRAPAEYRSEMVEVTARRALRVALARAGWRQPS